MTIPRTPGPLRLLAVIVVMAACGLARSAEPVIAEKDLLPNADLNLEMPALGESKVSVDTHPKKPIMVAMQAHLPSNYDRKRAHPVLCVYRGWNGSGSAFSEWNKVVDGQNFITLTVDYGAAGNDPDFHNMLYALKVLEKATAIDRTSLVLAADGGGAYMVASMLANDRAFCAFALLSGGDAFDGRALAGRPLLVIANSEDNGTDQGQTLTRYERELALYDAARKGGGSAELIIMQHFWAWQDTYGVRIRDWLHQAVPSPEIRHAYWIDRLVATSDNQDRQQWAWQKLADTWVELPHSAAARKQLNAPLK